MNTNLLLAVSAVMVGAILFSVNYPAISDFYTSSVPFGDFAVVHMAYSSDPDKFQKVKHQQDSTCFVTPSNHEYCYERPRGDEGFRFTYIFGSNGIDGEMHLEPVSRAVGYWAMSKIVPISETAAIITFSDNVDLYSQGIIAFSGSIDPPSEQTLSTTSTPEEFEFTKTVERYDIFVSNCRNDGKVLDIVQYLGVVTVEGTDYVATWHVHAKSEQGITCKYPEIIRHSFGHDFGI